TKGTHIISSKTSELSAVQASRGLKLKLRRQIMYFGFILAVVVPFATYEAKHKDIPFFSPLARTTDIVNLITQDFITLTMTASLTLPLVALSPVLRRIKASQHRCWPFPYYSHIH